MVMAATSTPPADLLTRERAAQHVLHAIAEATEEAILNAVFKATTLIGRDNVIREAVPIEPVVQRLRSAGVIA